MYFAYPNPQRTQMQVIYWSKMQAVECLEILYFVEPLVVEISMNFLKCSVYDWCYPLLTSQQKTNFITAFHLIANKHDPYFPASNLTGGIVG